LFKGIVWEEEINELVVGRSESAGKIDKKAPIAKKTK